MESTGYYLFRAVSAESIRTTPARVLRPTSETLLAEAAPDSGTLTTFLSWHAAAPGRYLVRVRESNDLGGIGASYLLSSLALPYSLYLPLISRSAILRRPSTNTSTSTRMGQEALWRIRDAEGVRGRRGGCFQ